MISLGIIEDAKAFRNDFMVGHSNGSGHGKGRGKDTLVRQNPGAARILTFQDCKDLYASNSLVRNIIDIIPEDMTRAGWTLNCQDKKLKQGIESKFRQLKLQKRFEKLYKDDRLFGDGYLSIGAIMSEKEVGENLSKEINPDKLMKIPYINAFPPNQVSRFFENQDMFSESYGEVELYEINRRSKIANEILSSSNMATVTNEKVHRSRIIHQQSIKFEDESEGRSSLESLYDIITVMDTSLWSVGQILYDYAFKVYKSPHVDEMTKADKAELGLTMDYMFRTEALAIIGGEDSITKESTSTTGMKELLDYGWDYLSGAVRMPKSVLKGQEAGTLTGAQYDVMNYYARVTSIQENELRPQLEHLTRLLMMCDDEKWDKTDPDSIEWSIEFNPLWSVDSKTDAEIRKLQAETDEKYIVNGVLDPEAVYENRFGRFGANESKSLNSDGIDRDTLDKMAEIVARNYDMERVGK